jgi:arylsulfatase
MSDKVIDVMIAGYLIKEPALLDYQAVLDSDAKIEGAVCITRDLEGNTSIEETDHMKRGGAKALGAAGFVVGLFAPPLLLATALGATVGAGLGHLAHSAVKSQLETQAAKTIPWGGAGVIIAYPRESAEAIDQAVSRALKKVVGEAEGSKVKALKGALADAQQKAAQPPSPPPAKA